MTSPADWIETEVRDLEDRHRMTREGKPMTHDEENEAIVRELNRAIPNLGAHLQDFVRNFVRKDGADRAKLQARADGLRGALREAIEAGRWALTAVEEGEGWTGIDKMLTRAEAVLLVDESSERGGL